MNKLKEKSLTEYNFLPDIALIITTLVLLWLM